MRALKEQQVGAVKELLKDNRVATFFVLEKEPEDYTFNP